MSCRTFARPAPLLLKNPEIPDGMIHPVPGTVLKIPGTPDQGTVIADNQAKMGSSATWVEIFMPVDSLPSA